MGVCTAECWGCASGSLMSGPMMSLWLTTWRLEAKLGEFGNVREGAEGIAKINFINE